MEQNKKLSVFGKTVCVTIFVVVLSQLPFLDEKGLTRYLAIGAFVFLSIVCLLKNKWKIHYGYIRQPIFLICVFMTFILVASVFNPRYIESALCYDVLVSGYAMIIGSMCGNNVRNIDIEGIMKAYVISTLLVFISIFQQYLSSSDITSVVYSYGSKNSAGLIGLTAAIFSIYFFVSQTSFIKRWIYLIVALVLIVIVFCMKCRAVIVSIPFLMVFVIMDRNTGRMIKKIMIVALLVVGAMLVYSDSIYDLVINNILFAGRETTNLEMLSSGRMSQWTSFPADFSKVFLFGTGGTYRESFFLASLLSYGLVGGIWIMAIAFYPIFFARRIKRRDSYGYICYLLAWAYILNGIFEEQAPFGPGVKCFFLWFLIGVLSIPKADEVCLTKSLE